MQKQCLKCGHVNPEASGAELEACPQCGAIYSRVEAAMAARGTPTPGRPAPPPQAVAARAAPEPLPPAEPPRRPARQESHSPYIETLRANSNYPTFRQVVGLFAGVGYLMAALVVVGSIFALLKVNIGGGLLGLAFALFIVVMTRIGKELSLMVADGSDAMVRAAERLEERV